MLEPRDKKSVRIYELYPVDQLITLKDQIEKVIIGPLGLNNKNGIFSIANTSGFLDFSDYTEIWSSKNSNNLSPNKLDVIKIVETFIDDINDKIIDFNKANKSALSGFFPTRNYRKVKKCDLVIHRNGNWYDHWLCTYELTIPGITSESDGSFIYGMGLDLRVGKNNKIIAISSNWRPFSKIITTDLYLPAEYIFVKELLDSHHEEDHSDDSDNSLQAANSQSSEIVYVFDGDAGNQYQLSPYYYEISGDHIIFFPACKYSLTIIITQEIESEKTLLTASVYGGSGYYKFSWAFWNNDTIWDIENQITIIGEGNIKSIKTEKGTSMASTISLPIKFYNILLNVADMKTGAYKHIQQTIF